ncbi:JAB domain-containing protein, partial [Anaerostipes sp.]
MIHNHPSGDPTPSRQDILTTRRMKEAGELVGIPLSDHIIIGDHAYVSFREEQII